MLAIAFCYIAKVSEKLGVDFSFTDNKRLKESGFAIDGVTVNGFVNEDGITSSAKALNSVVGHEITHVLEGTKLYDSLMKAVKAWGNTKGIYETRLKELTELYKDKEGYTGEDAAARIEREVVAELIGDYLFTDKEFVENLARENPGLFKRIFEEIKYLCKLVTAGSKEARQLEKVKKIFQDVYREGVKNPTGDGGVKYSLMAFEKDGRRFVEIDQEQDRFDGHSADEYPAIAKEIIKEKFENRVIGIDNKMFVNGAGRSEFAYPSKPIKEADIYEAKMRASAELDNLLDAGENFRNMPDGEDGHIHPDAIGGFDYFDTLFKIGKRYFEGRINIKNIKRGKLFTDVTQIKDVTQAIMSSYGPNPKSQFLRTSSMDSIRNSEGNVNNQNSLSAQGQVETDGQGWQVQGRDIALEQEQEGPGVPMPPGYQKGNPVAGATQKGSKASQTAREEGLPMPGETARVQCDRADGNLTSPEDAVRSEQQSLDDAYRRHFSTKVTEGIHLDALCIVC